MTETDTASVAAAQTALAHAAADAAPQETGDDDLPPEGMRAELKRARDDAAKYRQRARDNQGAADRLAEMEQAKKSELEQLTERSEGLLHRATSAEDEVARLRVALGAGIDPSRVDEFASRLRGDTVEDLTADAEKLAAFFAPTAPVRRGDPAQGSGADRAATVDPLQAALENKLSIGR